ncbi:VOC family protein [Streptomyces sp. NPDC018031]|uniref:VOC family protein n=1 Tax=Streptomyces sp. NPDC018031 TaxID=3365033 RepID=UPI0037B1285C
MTEAPARCAPGTPCWTSLMVHSLAATQDFYHALFGWDFTPGPQQLGAYVRGTLDGHAVAGIGELPAGRRLPVAWTTYMASDDADDTAKQIRDCGGTVAVGPLDAEKAGRMVIAADPAGATFGVWQARAHVGAERFGVPGTPAWHELVTYETARVGRFYEVVFGHRARPAEPAGGADRTTLYVGDRAVAAIQGVGTAALRDRGPRWMTYFEVADADTAARRVTELGGRVIRPPHEEPVGRCAQVADPEGAVFTVVRKSG